MLILHRRRRLGLLESNLDPRHLRDDGFVPLGDQFAKKLEGFGLVLVERISLGHSPPADDLSQVIERDEMLAPQMIQ